MLGLLGTYPYQTLTALFFGCVLFRYFSKGRNGNPKGLPLPPGPKGYPLIGNIFDVPVDKPWVVYEEWCKTYGDIVYFNVLGQSFLVLGSQRRTTDLFEKRSLNYSDRIQMPMVELMKWDFATVFLAYGMLWRRHRKLFHEHFQPTAVSKYLPIQRQEVHTFLRRLLVTPDNFAHHIRHLSAATIMKITYGIDIQHQQNDSLLGELAEGYLVFPALQRS